MELLEERIAFQGGFRLIRGGFPGRFVVEVALTQDLAGDLGGDVGAGRAGDSAAGDFRGLLRQLLQEPRPNAARDHAGDGASRVAEQVAQEGIRFQVRGLIGAPALGIGPFRIEPSKR